LLCLSQGIVNISYELQIQIKEKRPHSISIVTQQISPTLRTAREMVLLPLTLNKPKLALET
jgi:hypothetical protein